MGFRLEAFGLEHEPGCRDSGKEIIGMFQCPKCLAVVCSGCRRCKCKE